MKWTHIIIHHSQSKDHDTLDWDNVRKWHLDNGWADIGYHYGIERIEGNYEVLKGRSLQLAGAHCKGMNKNGIGICLIGNYDIDFVDEKAYIKLAMLISDLRNIFKIPIENVKLHSEYSTKTCPGKNFDIRRVI